LERKPERRKKMKMRNVVFSLILVVGIALSLFLGQAWGWGGVTNPYGVDPTAAGTKYSGPLTIYFECVPLLDKKGNVINPCSADVYHLYFFVRLNQGNNFYDYSYDAGVVPHENLAEINAFRDFIEKKLIPDICTISPCPSFANGRVALQSVTNNYYYFDLEPYYFIADIVIAVKP